LAIASRHRGKLAALSLLACAWAPAAHGAPAARAAAAAPAGMAVTDAPAGTAAVAARVGTAVVGAPATTAASPATGAPPGAVIPATAPAPRPAVPAAGRRSQADSDDYTRYELLPPGSSQFHILYEVTATSPGATAYFNPIRKGSEASGEAIYDRASGKALSFAVVGGS